MEFLPIIIILIVFWLLLILPQQRQRKRTRAMQQGVGVGDGVVLTSGIYGHVAHVDEGDQLGVEIADDVVITVARAAIGGIQPPDDEGDDEGEGYDDSDDEAYDEGDDEAFDHTDEDPRTEDPVDAEQPRDDDGRAGA